MRFVEVGQNKAAQPPLPDAARASGAARENGLIFRCKACKIGTYRNYTTRRAGRHAARRQGF